MDNNTVDFEGIEQELQEIRSRFSRADIVLRDLEEIQSEFEGLAKTHQKLKEYVSEVSRFNDESNHIIKLIQQTQTNFEQRFEKLTQTNEIKTKELNDKLNEIQNKLNSHHSQIHELHQSFVDKLPLFQEFQFSLKEIENKFNTNRNNFNAAINKIQTDADKRFIKLEASCRRQEKSMRIMWYVMIILFTLSLCLSAWVWLK